MSELSMFRPNSDIVHLAIDGGTATVGLCLFQVIGNKLFVKQTRLLDASKNDEKYRYLEIRHGALDMRLMKLRDMFMEYLDGCGLLSAPVFYESHFINPKRPASVIPLARAQQELFSCLYQFGVAVETVTPQEMKRLVGVKGKLSKADKDAVYQAIKQLVVTGEIEVSPEVSLDNLSEHEIDAIGIAYAGVLRYLR